MKFVTSEHPALEILGLVDLEVRPLVPVVKLFAGFPVAV